MVAGVSQGCGDIKATAWLCSSVLADSCLTLAELMGAYEQNCSRHQVQPRSHILQQLQVGCYTYWSYASFVCVKQHEATVEWKRVCVCVYLLVYVQSVCVYCHPHSCPNILGLCIDFFHRVISRVLQLHVCSVSGFLIWLIKSDRFEKCYNVWNSLLQHQDTS